MAGSYRHATDDEGRLLNWQTISIATETADDAYQTIEEFYGMVWYLAGGDSGRVEEARQNYRMGLAWSPGVEPHEDDDE